MDGLPQLVELRVPYLDPSFEAMVRCQLKFAEEGYEKMSGVQRSVFVIEFVGPNGSFPSERGCWSSSLITP